MTYFARLGLAFLAMLFASSPTNAALTYYADKTDDGLSFVIVQGEFELGDDLAAFSREVARNEVTAVGFDSPGGSVAKAMELGRLIRSLGLSTLQPRGLECASACALAFMGGVQRVAQPGAIGVHRSSFADDAFSSPGEAIEHVQGATAKVVGYMVEMGIDAALLEVSLAYSKDDVRYLSLSEMERYRIVSSDRAAAPPAAPVPAKPPAAKAGANLEANVTTFVGAVINAHTWNEHAALQKLTAAYAGEVHYYGKVSQLGDVLKDKRAYFDRWPERLYAVRPQSVRVQCNDYLCIVSGIYDWSVRSVPRNRQASGSATFRYIVDIRIGMQIVGETSEVIGRQ
jgi:hypothetical protein